MPNSQISLIDFVQIVCAICNAFRPPRVKKSDEQEIVAERILRLVEKSNQLKLLMEIKTANENECHFNYVLLCVHIS